MPNEVEAIKVTNPKQSERIGVRTMSMKRIAFDNKGQFIFSDRRENIFEIFIPIIKERIEEKRITIRTTMIFCVETTWSIDDIAAAEPDLDLLIE